MNTLLKCWIGVGLIVVALGSIGCEDSANTGGGDMDSLAAQLEQSKQAKAAAAAAEQARAEAAQAAAAKAAAEKAAAEKAAAELAAKQAAERAHADNETSITITVKNPQGLLSGRDAEEAIAGIVGKKQRKNRVEGPLRYYGAMANARIIAMDRALGWQIKSALDVYVNGENDGKYPKTTEEFMEKVVKPNMIELPELEPNQEYYFDPQQHELVILERIDEPADAGHPDEQAPAQSTPPLQ